MKEIKNNGTVVCPKCGEGAEMHSTSASMFIYMVVSLLCLGVSVWIPILGWICAPIFIMMAIVFFIAAIIGLFTGGAKIECKNCNSKYKLTKEEFKRYRGKNTSSFSASSAGFAPGVKESWENSKEGNKHIFINKIEKLENKIENTTDEKKIAKMRKEIKRLEKHI